MLNFAITTLALYQCLYHVYGKPHELNYSNLPIILNFRHVITREWILSHAACEHMRAVFQVTAKLCDFLFHLS